MRKLTSLLLTVVLLLSCTVTAFAAEDDPVEIGVYAKTEQNIDGEYTAPIENGSASVTTPDGTVTVTNAPDNAVTLVVIPMEGEALTWVDGCVDGDAVAAYDIHFRDADGNRINANGAKVSITVSGTDLTVSSVTTSGEDKPLTSEVSGGKVSFTTDSSHYYVIAEKKDSITVPVSGEENTVHADVIVEGDTVKLEELDEDEIEQVVGSEVETGVVEVDLTGLDEDVTKIVLPVTTVEAVVEAAEEAGNDTEALQIDFPSGSVKLDDKTMRAVVEQAECNQVMLVLENVGETRLNDTQEAAIADMNVYGGYEAYMVCVSANKRISDFQGGVATLSVPFTVPSGLDANKFSVWYVADDGSTEKLDTRYANGYLVWDVSHFSDFIIVYEGEVEAETHTITVAPTTGGQVTVSTTTPKTGETVTITVKPDDGKTVDQVKVTDESGKAVTVTDNGDGTYTFTQPDGDVTVEVTFKDKAPAPADEYEVIVEKTSGGKVEISDDTPVAGQTVTITPKPNSGKVVKKVTVTDENGKSVKVTDNGDGTYSFVQPDSDVTVKVTFKNKPSSGDLPQTGDTMCLHLWILILLISGMMLIYIGNKMRKQEAE